MIIARRGATVSGIDLSADALREAVAKAKTLRVSCGFSRQDVQSLGFPENTFDKVVSSSALEHFEHDDIALIELTRVLKPGGLLVLTCDSLLLPMKHGMKELHKRRAGVVNYYSARRITTQLERAGLDVARVDFLLRTPFTNAFYQVGIMLRWKGLLWVGISLIATPLCLLSEKASRDHGRGQTLIVQAQKRSRTTFTKDIPREGIRLQQADTPRPHTPM